MKSRVIRNRRGNALLWVVGFAAILGMLAITVPRLVSRSFSHAIDMEREFEAQVLASNVKEIAKYLVLYEKIFFTGALNVLGAPESDPLVINSSLRALWGQSFTSLDPANTGMGRACGGYTLGAKYLGIHKVDGRQVFCPMYFRTHLFTGLMSEQMLFEQWSHSATPVLTPGASKGTYKLTIHFDKSFSEDDSRMIPLDLGERLISEQRRGLEAFVEFTFSTDSSGFRSISSERYLHIKATVKFKGDKGLQYFVEDEESIMMALSTPKDFAFFIPFPSPSRLWSETMQFANPSDVKIFGRTFFRGNLDGIGATSKIDEDILRLPRFNDSVVLSGTFSPKIPGPKYLPALKERFPKGLVTNFSAARFVLDGKCAKPADSTTRVQNMSEIHCESLNTPNTPMTIDEYVANLQQDCNGGSFVVQGSAIKYEFPTDIPPPAFPGKCRTTAGNWAGATRGPATAIEGGAASVRIEGPTALLVSPIANLTVARSGAVVRGLIFGGNVVVSGPAEFWSLGSLQPGKAGNLSAQQMAEINNEAALAYAGVAVPIVNLPIVYSTREGVK